MRTHRWCSKLLFYFLSILLVPFIFCNNMAEATKALLIEDYKINVVQLTVEFSNNQRKFGFGFIVGERDNTLYLVTSNHVVRETDLPEVRTKEIKARFFTDQGKFYRAELLSASLSDLDLAMLEVRVPYHSYKWQKFFHCPKVSRGEKVKFIGRNQEWWIPAVFGYVQDDPYRGKFLTTIRDILPGTSGAPLISKDGIIGMIITDDGNDVETVEIGEIKTFVQRKGYPWNIAECLNITISPKRQRMGYDVRITFDKPTRAKVKFQGKWLPKTSQANGQILRVTIPGGIKPGHWPFEIEWQGHTYLSESIEIYVKSQNETTNTRKAPPSKARRRAPPAP